MWWCVVSRLWPEVAMDSTLTRATLPAFVKQALLGARLLTGQRPSCAMLARLLGVGKAQPARWQRGEAFPRRGTRMRLRILAKLGRRVQAHVLRAEARLAELSAEGCDGEHGLGITSNDTSRDER